MPYKDLAQQREYQRLWMANRRAEFFKDKKCVQCGSTKELELDHIDPADKVTHAIWSWAQERRETEIAKCQVLCSECHKRKTIEQLTITHGFKAYRHGTGTMYKRHGCKCGLCMLWNRNRKRDQRAKQRACS